MAKRKGLRVPTVKLELTEALRSEQVEHWSALQDTLEDCAEDLES
jgi:hypothetical protein